MGKALEASPNFTFAFRVWLWAKTFTTLSFVFLTHDKEGQLWIFPLFVQQILFDRLLHARHWANFFLWGSHGLECRGYIQWDLLHFPDTDQSCCLQGIWMILSPFQISWSVICAEGDFVNSLGLLAMFWNSHLSDHLIFLKKLRCLIIESLVEFQYIKQSKVRLPWLELRRNACSFLLGLPLPSLGHLPLFPLAL